MINDTIKNNKDSATIILFSFLNPTIPKGMATNANEIFGSSQCSYEPVFILKINIQKPNTKKPTAKMVSTISVFFL